jgi:uncharacterized protein (TIGR02588 family)
VSPKAAKRDPRTPAEWVTFAVSVAILLVVVGLITTQANGSDRPALPRVTKTGPVEQRGDRYLVPVEIRNDGGATAEAVQVTAELTVGEEVVEADQTVEFLAQEETAEVVFVFDQDPGSGQLDVRVTGYTVP